MPLRLIALLLVVAAVWAAQVLLIPLVLAALLTCGLEPIHRRLVQWHVPRSLSAAVILFAVVGALAGAAWGLRAQGATFVNHLPTLSQKLREAVRDGRGAFGSTVQPVQRAADELKKVADESAPPPARGVTRVQVEEPGMRASEWLWRGTMGAIGMLTQATMVLFVVYYLLASGDRYKQKILRIVGPSSTKRHVTIEILNRITEQIARFLVARVLISFLVGGATSAALMAFGMPQAIIWGIVAGVLNNIPYLGPSVAVGAIALAGLVQFGNLEMAGAVGGVAALIALVEGFAITPWIMGRAGRMNTGAVFVSLMFWGWIWGVWGMLFAVPIMMAIKAVCDHVDAFRPVSEVLSE